ncbi:MAG: hypothetical protein ACP5I4_11470 [Oceanipulchritudo sp.]
MIQGIFGSVDSVSITNTTFADAGYLWNGINVTTDVTFTKNTFFTGSQVTREMRVGFQLLDSGGNPVTLNTPGGTGTVLYDDDWEGDADAGFPITISSIGTSVTESFAGRLRPVAQLDPTEAYAVRVLVYWYEPVTNPITGITFNRWTVDDSLDAAPQNYLHFVGDFSGDANLNVISVLNSVSFTDRSALLGADPSTDAYAFQVNANTTLYRFDDWDAARTQTSVQIIYSMELWRKDALNGDEQIPINQDQFSFNELLYNYDINFFDIPTSRTVNHSLGIVPLVQLDPVNEQYYARVQVTHVENPFGPLIWPGNIVNSTSEKLMHFNGQLFFNSFETTMEDFANDPAPGASWFASYVQGSLNGAVGFLTGSNGYKWGPASLTIRLSADGSATVVSPTFSVPVVPPDSPDIGSVGGVRFERGDLTLDHGQGLLATVTTILPTGMAWMNGKNDLRANGTLVFPGTLLTQDLLPSGSSYTYTTGSNFYVVEETKPLAFEASAMVWEVGSGQVTASGTSQISYVREDELGDLAVAPVPSLESFKRSNEQHYRAVGTLFSSTNIVVVPGSSGEALLTADMSMGSGSFLSHFPHDVKVSFSSGYLSIVDDLIDVDSSYLGGAADLEILYNQACLGEDCGAAVLSQAMRMIPLPGEFRFTSDGGLVAQGIVDNSTTPDNLAWGYIDSLGDFHHQTSSFLEVDFHMPGHFIRGDQSTAPTPSDGPGLILYSGFLAEDPTVVERPGTNAYLDGLADYAGFNYRVGQNGSVFSFSIIAGQNATFDLTGRCKYYIRPGGLIGIHEAVPGTFPESFTLYGYDMTFSQYGLNYRMNQPGDSRTEGAIYLPYPSNFTQPFEEMLFTCLGGLDEAKVPAGTGDQVMEYWLANISIHTLDFASENGCDPTADTFLLAGVTGEAAYIDAPLYGTLGYLPSGELMIPSSSSINEDSRLYLPAVVRFDGPTKETDPGDPSQNETEVYQLVPATLAYYNDYASSGNQAPGNGIINFAGTLDVAFFEDLEVHMQTSARNVLPTQTVPIHLMGGWTEGTSPQKTFFNSPAFDEDNTGFPAGVPAAVYRNEAGNGGDPTPYLIHARQDWLGVVNFDYPLKWSNATRSFESYEPKTDDFLVITSEHKLDYLSAETAELSLGITYEGIPEINLTNFVINEIDKNTGVFQSLLLEAKKPVVDAIERGVDDMAEMLNDNMEALYAELISTIEQDVVEQVYKDLESAAKISGTYNPSVANGILKGYLTDTNATLKDLLKQMADPVGDASYLFAEIDKRLENIEVGINAIIDAAYIDANGNLVPTPSLSVEEFTGFLTKNNGDFQILNAFIERLLAELAPEINNELNALLAGAVDDLNARINDLLTEVEPTIDQVVAILTDLRDTVTQVRTAVAQGGELINELNSIITKAEGEIDAMTADILNELDAFFATIPDPEAFLSYTKEEIKSRIRNEIRDLLFGTDFIAEIQVTLKQYFYDVDAAINEAISEAFAQVNKVVRDLVSDVLSEVDDTINGFLGDISDTMGAGKLNGYAQFNGDALRRLHIDLYLQLNIPDEMEFNGYLTIEQFDSEGDDTCSPGTPGGVVTEVSVGATDVGADWIAPDLRISVGGKFNFQGSQNFKPLGLGGSFELTSGEVSFESFRITAMGAALMFGASENYLAAELGLAFNSYEAYGGVYFGRTCSIDPLLMVDPDVAALLGDPDPTFTGIYMYGECHIPVSEAALGIPATCMFRITAGVGAGAFYFVEGNTLGGKIYAAASGEALCLVSIKGEVTMIGLMQAGELSFQGKGKLSGKVGACPFCIKFGKTASVKFKGGSWDVDL